MELHAVTYLIGSMGLEVWTFIKKGVIELKMECEAASDSL